MATSTQQHAIASDDALYFANSGGDSNLFDSAEDPSGKNTPQFRHNKIQGHRYGGPRPIATGPSGMINTTPGARCIP